MSKVTKITKKQEQRSAAHFIHAAAQLLTGKPGQSPDLDNRVILIFGPQPNFPTLLHWGSWVRKAGVPILSFYFDAGVPVLSLVGLVNGQTVMHERCFIWARNAQSAIHIVPDGFHYGAFVVDPEHGLKHLKRAPFSRVERGIPGVREAVSRLDRFWTEHMEANPDVSLPSHLERKAA